MSLQTNAYSPIRFGFQYQSPQTTMLYHGASTAPMDSFTRFAGGTKAQQAIQKKFDETWKTQTWEYVQTFLSELPAGTKLDIDSAVEEALFGDKNEEAFQGVIAMLPYGTPAAAKEALSKAVFINTHERHESDLNKACLQLIQAIGESDKISLKALQKEIKDLQERLTELGSDSSPEKDYLSEVLKVLNACKTKKQQSRKLQ